MAENIGKVISVSGPAVDVQFDEANMPPIFQALRITSEGFDTPLPMNVIVEVQQHLGEGRVRCIAMTATEGMVRGMKALDTGAGILVPVGREDAGTRAECARRTGRRTWSGERKGPHAHSPSGTFFRGAVDLGRDV